MWRHGYRYTRDIGTVPSLVQLTLGGEGKAQTPGEFSPPMSRSHDCSRCDSKPLGGCPREGPNSNPSPQMPTRK